MNLYDFGKAVIIAEPPEGKSKVHKLGHSIACWETGECININILRDDVVFQVTDILSAEVDTNGNIITARSTTIGPDLVVSRDEEIRSENLAAFSDYILDQCLELVPALNV